jgi:RHS repeat-associated protein
VFAHALNLPFRVLARLTSLALIGLLSVIPREAYGQFGEPSVEVIPDGEIGPNRLPFSSGHTATFTVINVGTGYGAFSSSCSTTGPVTCTGNSGSGGFVLAPDQQINILAYYNVGAAGTGTLTLTVTSDNSSAQDEGSFTIPVVNPSPLVSLAPHNASYRDVAKCVAACFDVVMAHSTPPYHSLGTPRSVTVVYNSSMARPTPVILMDVSNSGTPYPTHYSVQVRRVSPAVNLTLLNGAQAVYYVAGTTTTSRLAAVFDARANGLPTGWHDVQVIVTSHYSDATTVSTTLGSRVLVVDRSGSSFGVGVDIAGLQRLYSQPGYHSILLTEGDGSAAFYRRDCPTCTFATPGGTAATLSYNSGTSTYRRTYLSGSFIEFNSAGRIIRAVAFPFDTTLMTWSDTLLTAIRDPMGNVITLAYTTGKLATVTDPGGRVTAYGINANGRLWRVTDPDTRTNDLSYTGLDLLQTVVGRSGDSTSFAYDALNRLDSTQAARIAIHNGAQVRPTLRFTAAERVVWQPGITGVSTATAKGAVRADTARATVRDPLGATTRFSVDRFGGPTAMVDVLGQTTTVTRDTMGRPMVVTAPNGHITRATYTGNLLTEEKDSTTGLKANYTYSGQGDLITISGDVVRRDFYYGASTRWLDSVRVGSQSAVTEFQRDPRGRVQMTRDGAGHIYSTTYDPAWGSVRTHNQWGNQQNVRYDQFGRVDTSWTPGGFFSLDSMDVMNRVWRHRDPAGSVTRYFYGATTLDSVMDPKGQTYRFRYNPLGWLVALHDLGDPTRVDSFKYDEVGNLRWMKTRRGHIITMTYDAAGRLLTRTGPDIPTDSFRYDPAGRWMVAVNSNAYDSVAFDVPGRPIADVQKLAGVTYQLTYAYNQRGQLLSRVGPTAAHQWRAAYNATTGGMDTLCAAAQCVAITADPEFYGTAHVYGPGPGGPAWTALRAPTPGHGTGSESYPWHPWMDSAFGANWDYGFDGQNLLRRFDPTMSTQPTRLYAYDRLGRLVNACDSVGGTCLNEYGFSDTAYAYDSASNRIDPRAFPTVIAGNRVTAFRGYTLGYDLDGNMISKVGNGLSRTYVWDALNQLREIWNGGILLAAFAYDALGRRVSKTTPIEAERYVYDRENVILDLNGAGQVKREYGYWPGQDDLFSYWTPTDSMSVVTDPVVGTVRGVARVGAAPTTYSYTPWGEVQAGGGVTLRFGLGGREYDGESGLYYNRARFYDPQLGRFMSEDPIGIGGGLNLYVYAENDPVNRADPNGLCPSGTVFRSYIPLYVDEAGRLHVILVCQSAPELVGGVTVWGGNPCRLCYPSLFEPGTKERGPTIDLLALARWGRQHIPMDDELVRGLTKASSAAELQAGVNRVEAALREGNLPAERARALRGWRKVVRREWLPNALKGGGAALGVLFFLGWPEPLGEACRYTATGRTCQ